jgi:hypothetical protein
MHAFCGQRFGAATAEALAGCADKRAAAFDSKIHDVTPEVR